MQGYKLLFLLVLSVIYCVTHFKNLIIELEPYGSYNDNGFSSETSYDATAAATWQSYVISLHRSNVIEFGIKNQHCGFNITHNGTTETSLTWFPATNGRDEAVLDEWANISKLKRARVETDKYEYDSPHAVGVYMSHWHLLRLVQAGWGPPHQQTRPDALFVFEDDAMCVKNTRQLTLDGLISSRVLPDDWDILFIGGKPFSFLAPTKTNNTQTITKGNFRHLACQGAVGVSKTGPFAPDGSRQLSPPDDDKAPYYWKTKYFTNTHAYVVNPQRIEHILNILEEPKKRMVPVDIVYADAMKAERLNAFMTSKELCCQEKFKPHKSNLQPNPWEGYYHHPQLLKEKPYKWDEMYFAECPSTYKNGML